ncbi:hypothetical protein AnigIFM60653_011940 [Aspergillus niger]|nr:hypothetical protein AnigIFM60653_011940 [Aspergillus niger]
MPQFPFVIVPTQLNVPALRQQFPFLLLCIITACLEHKPSLQHLMEQEVRKAIAIRLITNMERSMDLALGLLVHIAWYHYHRPTYHPQARRMLPKERIPGSVKGMTWQQLFESMGLQQKHTEKLLRQYNLWDNWALRMELSAMPMLVLGQALGRHKNIFHLHSEQRLPSLTSSAYNTVDTFLAIPSPALVHLPALSYNTLWYSLLVLTKLNLLFGAQLDIPEIGRISIRNIGLALLRKIGELSQDSDVWEDCRRALRSMLLWLENTTSELQHGQIALSAQGARYGNADIRLHNIAPASQQGLLTQVAHSQNASSGCYPPRVVIDPPEFPSAYPEGDYREAALWDQMLEELNWLEAPFGPDLSL